MLEQQLLATMIRREAARDHLPAECFEVRLVEAEDLCLGGVQEESRRAVVISRVIALHVRRARENGVRGHDVGRLDVSGGFDGRMQSARTALDGDTSKPPATTMVDVVVVV